MRAVIVGFAAAMMFGVPAWAQSVVSPDQAGQHVGGTVTVEGIASITTASSGAIIITLGDKNFSAVILANSAGAFRDIAALNGKLVDITGTVQMFQGKPEIILNSPNQIVAK